MSARDRIWRSQHKSYLRPLPGRLGVTPRGRSRRLELGLPIGSGMIESGHRHVLQARLKKAGTAWLSDHADQIAHLRVLRANNRWLSLWN